MVLVNILRKIYIYFSNAICMVFRNTHQFEFCTEMVCLEIKINKISSHEKILTKVRRNAGNRNGGN